MLKVAQYAAQLENYDRAIKIYEDVSKHVIKTYDLSLKQLQNDRT